jgi:hypothetical protein
MKCLSKEILTRYYDKELPGNEINRVAAHLENCQTCKHKLLELKKEITFIEKKLELLNPPTIPSTVFTPTPTRTTQNKPGFVSRWADIIKSSIRVPVPTFALLLVLVCLMAVGLFLQERKIARLESPLLAAKRQTTLYLISENRIQSVSLDAELEGFEPIKKPKIFVQKEKIK